MTNREWLNTLSDEELIKYINLDCRECPVQKECWKSDCDYATILWLQAEHKGE
nr:MAG TPA: Transcription factor WhiB [Caudoviricetes sp.]